MTESTEGQRGRTSGTIEETVHTQHDWMEIEPSTAVVETVATALDRDPTTLDAMFESVDPDALDAVVRTDGHVAADRDVSVSFVYAGLRVTVFADGDVLVGPTNLD